MAIHGARACRTPTLRADDRPRFAHPIPPALHDSTFGLVRFLCLSQQAVKSISQAIGHQVGNHSKWDRVVSVDASTHSLPILDSAIIFSAVTLGTELMISHGMRCVSNPKTCLSNSHRIFRIFAEAGCSWPDPRIEKADALINFSFERHVGAG